jgi:hypothetical protein
MRDRRWPFAALAGIGAVSLGLGAAELSTVQVTAA